MFKAPWSLRTLARCSTQLGPCVKARSTIRPFSHGSAKDLTEQLARTQPAFNLSGSNINVLNTPTQFYASLLDMIRRAKRRIALSSLYIGADETELIQSLHSALLRNPNLTLDLHLDLLRSTRPEQPNTVEVLLPLIKSFGEDRVRINLFRTPKLKGLMARLVPRRFDEGWGTWHAKLYAVDDEIMVSGANLNRSYFTNRKDRYLHFASQPHLTVYGLDYLRTLGTYSHRLAPVPGTSNETAYQIEWRNIHTTPTSFEGSAKADLKSLQERWRTREHQSLASNSDADTVIFPIVQSGVLGIREEEQAIDTLFNTVSQTSATVDLTSGYFGLYAPYKRKILSSPNDVRWRIVAASPKANGFYGSKGISGRLPEAYTWLERKFWQAAVTSGKEDSVELDEWARDGWTYHAKGIWVRFDSAPTVTLFGSTNLNSRSANLDTELSFLMVTTSKTLSDTLSKEVGGIREHAAPVGKETWEQPERRVRWSTIGMAKLVSGML